MQTISEWHYLPAAKMCMSVTIWLIRIYQSHLTSVSLENFKKYHSSGLKFLVYLYNFGMDGHRYYRFCA